ncbi:MAG: ABC transporter permease [Burkholderiaceae bacterium]
MFKLALRNIFRQRARTCLTLVAIALGVASLVLSGGFVEDILLQLREATIRSQLGHLQIYKQGQFSSGGHRPFDFLIDNPDVVERVVEGLAGVLVHARRVSFSGLISNGRGELPILGQGVEPESEARIGSAISMLSGRQLVGTDEFGIIVGEGLAKAMNLKVGDNVNLVLTTREGAMNVLDFQLVGIFRSLSKEYDARAVRIPLRAAQELTATAGVGAIVVLLADTDLTARVAAELKAGLPSGFEVKTWQELADFYTNTAALYQRQFGVLQVIIVVMVLLSVANSVNMTLHERTLEFGIMRALGRTGRHVFCLAVLETAILGAVGAALGVAIGVVLAVGVSAIGIPMPPPPNSESAFTGAIRVVPTVVAVAFALGLLATIVASLLPARRLARISVVEALRRGV